MHVVEELREEGINGIKTALDRPGLTDLFVAGKTKGARLMLVENATCIARDLMPT